MIKTSIGFLSVPVLRNFRLYSESIASRQISSSPAKSDRVLRTYPTEGKIRTRRLSQDSGIVSGRLFGGLVSINHIVYI